MLAVPIAAESPIKTLLPPVTLYVPAALPTATLRSPVVFLKL